MTSSTNLVDDIPSRLLTKRQNTSLASVWLGTKGCEVNEALKHGAAMLGTK